MPLNGFLSRLKHRTLVRKRRFVYHILSGDILESVLQNGKKLQPRRLGYVNGYANPSLVKNRGAFIIDRGLSLNDAVPFYLSPRQPMFCRLVREKRLSSFDIVALGYDFDQIRATLNPQYALFSTNPVYDGCLRLADWDARDQLDWNRLCAWRWNNDTDPKVTKRAKSAIRQAELDIFSSIPLQLLAHVVTDIECPCSVKILNCPRVVIRGLSVW